MPTEPFPDDPNAFLAHDELVRSLARGLLSDENEVEDAVQHTWLAAVRRGPRKMASLRSWLAAVVRNRARDLLRSKARRGRRERAAARDEALPSTLEIVEREAARHAAVQAVLALEEPLRTTLLLRYFEGLPIQAIADRFEAPVETVRTRIKRGLELARAHLDRTHGSRRAWHRSFLVLAAAPRPIPIPPFRPSLGDLLLMATPSKAVLSCAALAILAAGLWLAFAPGTGGLPAPPEPGDTAAAAESAGAAARTTAEAPAGSAGGAAQGRAAAGRETAISDRGLGRVVGRVVEPSGAPVAGARVEALGISLGFLTAEKSSLLFDRRAAAPRWLLGEATTGEDGRFQLDGVDPRECWLLGVNLGGPRASLRFLDGLPNARETVDLGEIALETGRPIVGKLVDPAGAPVAGARVRATGLPARVVEGGLAFLRPGQGFLLPSSWLSLAGSGGTALVWQPPRWIDEVYSRLPFPTATTGADGGFKIEGAPSDVVHLLVDAPGLPASYLGPFGGSDLGKLVLTAGAAVEGIVVDEAGAPVAGAEVRAAAPSSLFPSELAFLGAAATAGADGRFRCAAPAGGKLRFAARAPGAAAWIATEARDAGAPQRIVVPRPQVLLVKVLDASRQPIDATLAVTRGGNSSAWFASRDVEMKLSYEVRNAKKAQTALDKMRADGMTQVKIEATMRVIEERAMAEQAAKAAARADDLEAAKNAKIWADRVASLQVGEQLETNLLGYSKGAGRDFADSFLEEPLAVRVEDVSLGVYRIHGLTPGSYWIHARIQGTPIASATATISKDKESEVTLEGTNANSVAVRVVVAGAAGPAPLRHAQVVALDSGFYSPLRTAPRASVVTNEEGSALLAPLGTGFHRILVSHPAYAPSVADLQVPVRGEVAVTLMPGGTIEGRVHLGGGNPKEPRMLVLESGSADPLQPARRTITGEDGRFRIEHLAPGAYKVLLGERLLRQPIQDKNPFDEWRTAAINEARDCAVEEGKTTYLNIDLLHPEKPPLRGEVRVNGAVARDFRVEARGPASLPLRVVDELGTFDLGPAQPGEYSLLLYAAGTKWPPIATVKVVVRAGELFFYRWDVSPARVAGVVRDPQGNPVAGASVTARRHRGPRDIDLNLPRQEVRTTTDALGAFSFEMLASGDYGFYATRNLESAYPVTVSAAEGRTSRVELRLVVTVSYAGRIEFQAPGKTAYAQLSLKASENPDPEAIRTVAVDLESLAFDERLRPGRYRATLQIYDPEKVVVTYRPIEVEVPAGGVRDVLLRFER